jgi:hypothetical protein
MSPAGPGEKKGAKMYLLKKLKKLAIVFAALVIVFLFGGENARAVPFFSDPAFLSLAGLNPGDHFRLAFVTEGLTTAASSDITDYNMFVTAEAERSLALTKGLAAAFGFQWKAIASTLASDARIGTDTDPSTTGVPIVKVDGTRIADDNTGLWSGFLKDPLAINQFGQDQTANSSFAWTGTSFAGNALVSSTDFLGAQTPGYGEISSQIPDWIQSPKTNTQPLDNSTPLPLYAISGVIRVPNAVPEPDCLVLFGLGVAGLGWCRRRKKRNDVSRG